jgi:SRSO17 transposase
MNGDDIAVFGGKLQRFLGQFSSHFASFKGRDNFERYVAGQLSGLQRKSIEPMADAIDVCPRRMQLFLSNQVWDEEKVRDKIQEIVMRKFSSDENIGIIDETSFAKKGNETACVQRQYCGTTGKRDNCVVSVHLAFATQDFHTLIDASLYLPRPWDEDRERRERALVPEDLTYRSLQEIAIDQIRRAQQNRVRLDWITADAGYGKSPKFLGFLEESDQPYVVEVPVASPGWVARPGVLLERTRAMEPGSGPRKFPRLAANARAAKSVANLVAESSVFTKQEWTPFRVKETEKGPEVWEAKWSRFFAKRDDLPSQELLLVVARNVLDGDVKYFVVNAPADTPIATILRVAFTRWRVERCFRDTKTDLGMDHFEVRLYPSIIRHLIISMVSQLFLAGQRERLKKGRPA